MARPVTHDDTVRTRLLQAAAEALADGGVTALSLRSIATAAGTSTSAVYTLFGDKAALVEAVATEAERSFRVSQETVPVTADPIADLRALGLAYRAWALANPSLYAVMFAGRIPGTSSEPTGSDELEVEPSILPLVTAIARAVEAGTLGGASVEVIVLSVWAMVHGQVTLELAACDSPVGAGLAASHHDYLDAVARAWAVR